jgi:DNA-directed RNA polymerase subunit E'/Rpb7
MQNRNQTDRKLYGVYVQSLLTKKVFLSINDIGSNIKGNLEKLISNKLEGRCIVEGFVKPKTINVTSYSSGKVNGEVIEYHAIFDCMICHPVEGMIVDCKVKTITKVGIHAEVIDEDGNIPIIVFVSRDHHYNDFSKIKEEETIRVNIVGTRFELNDPNICCIGYLVE